MEPHKVQRGNTGIKGHVHSCYRKGHKGKSLRKAVNGERRSTCTFWLSALSMLIDRLLAVLAKHGWRTLKLLNQTSVPHIELYILSGWQHHYTHCLGTSSSSVHWTSIQLEISIHTFPLRCVAINNHWLRIKSGASWRQSDFLNIQSLTFLFISVVDWLAFRLFYF